MTLVTAHITTASLAPFKHKLEAAVGDQERADQLAEDMMRFVIAIIATGKTPDPRQLAKSCLAILEQDDRNWDEYRAALREAES